MELNYNRVELRGVAEDAPLLSHVNHGCAFYRFTLSVLRLSGQADKLPVIVPRPLLLLTPVSPGDGVHITGQLRSFNNKSGQGSRLVISTFAQTLTHDAGEPLNRIFLSGVLCKQPALRRTPLGREICDMILAVKLAPSTIGALLEEKFTEDELKQLISIIESPVNRKFSQMGGDFQKALGEKLIAQTQSIVEPKVKALEQAVVKHLGLPSAPPNSAPETPNKAPKK